MLLPGIAVFLDVDDLDDIGDLEGYIKATGVMLCFLSRRYFVSTNCLREVRATFDQGKPIVLVHEEQEGKGGGPLEALQAECPEDMRGKIFERRKPITFHRISHFRNLTLKLIATEMLQCSPRYLDVVSGVSLVMPGEATASELSLPQPLVLWCSAGNPSAAGVAQELAAALGVGSDGSIRVQSSRPDPMELERRCEKAFMLLVLDRDTWVKQGAVLERDVRAAASHLSHITLSSRRNLYNVFERTKAKSLKAKSLSVDAEQQTAVKIILVHENDPAKGGCAFSTFFDTTPEELVNEGIYRYIEHMNTLIDHVNTPSAIFVLNVLACGSDIAIAMHKPPHRSVSIALLAQALGAKSNAQRRLGGTFVASFLRKRAPSETVVAVDVAVDESAEPRTAQPSPLYLAGLGRGRLGVRQPP